MIQCTTTTVIALALLASPCLTQQDVTSYVRYSHDGSIAYGILRGETITQLEGDLFSSPRETAKTIPLADVELLAPIEPSKVIAVGLNYLDHAKEQKEPVPERPLLFAKFPTAIIGPDEPVKIPPISQKVDPEAELCIVMLKGGRQFSKESAKSAAAFMVGNDVSARDLQFSDKQWVRGKSCDTFAPCGPFIVTMEDVGDPHNLTIELTVNDRVQQSSNTNNLIFDCWHLIEYISQAVTLEIGDIIFTGTPSGVGVFRDPPVFVEPGDVLEVTIEKLGTLRNPVVAG